LALSRIAIGATLALLMPSPPPQLPVLEAPPEVMELVAGYRHLVERYRRGDAGAVDAVIALPQSQLDSIIKLIFGVPDMPWARQDELRAWAMLHTDAAVRVVLLNDGAGETLARHLNLARRMLHASGPRDDPFFPRWYYAVSRALRHHHRLNAAEDLLERGRSDVPGNPTILYESATVAETLARGYSLAVRETVSGIPSIEPDPAGNLRRRARLLNDAGKWLREAVERDPAMLLARLHLGRVETLLSREQEGLVHLERVFTDVADPGDAYLAALFSGAARERLRQPGAAAEWYRRAIARFPVGQAAYVALSEVLQRSGKTGEARAMLHGLLDGKAELTGEPWWWYLADPPGVAEARLAGLRREVRR
jgi:tetratricopeptide (TPR) repeat protein